MKKNIRFTRQIIFFIPVLFLFFIVPYLTYGSLKVTATSGTWSQPSAWIGGVPPTATDSIVISAGHIIFYDDNIHINAAGSITINGSLFCLADTFKVDCGGFFLNNGVFTCVVFEISDGINNGTIIFQDIIHVLTCSSGFTSGSIISNTTCGTTSIHSFDENPRIKTFPNPVNTEFHIETDEPGTKELILYDLSSRIIFRQRFNMTCILNTETFRKGVYLFEIYNSNGIITNGKMIKM